MVPTARLSQAPFPPSFHVPSRWLPAPLPLALGVQVLVAVGMALAGEVSWAAFALAAGLAMPPALLAAGIALAQWRERRAAAQGLAAALADRSALLREINHRVGNSLQLVGSLVRLQAATCEPAAWPALQKLLARVLAVGEVHKRLQEIDAIEAVDMDGYLRSLCAVLVQQLVPEGGQVTIRAVPVPFPVEPAARVGLAVGELLGNAVEHAYAPGEPVRVEVTLERAGDGYRLTVRDFGRGLPGGMVPAWQGSLGMTLLHSLAAELGGTLRFDGGPGGTLASLEFPRPVA